MLKLEWMLLSASEQLINIDVNRDALDTFVSAVPSTMPDS